MNLALERTLNTNKLLKITSFGTTQSEQLVDSSSYVFRFIDQLIESVPIKPLKSQVEAIQFLEKLLQ